MPQPMIAALSCGFIHVEQWAVSTEEDQELPEEYDREEVEGNEADGTVQVDERNAVLLSILLLQPLEHEVDAEESSEPEEAVDDMLG